MGADILDIELPDLEIKLPEINLELKFEEVISSWAKHFEDIDLPELPSIGTVGRPSRITQGVLAKLEVAFSLGCSDREACSFAGINPATLYRYQNKNPEFSERKEGLKTCPTLIARFSVIKGFSKNPLLALRYLERKCPEEFGRG